jgi:hypothetical protein
MKTKRLGSILLRRSAHCARRRATSGRSRSLATTVFFEAEPLGVNEIPHRAVVDVKAALGELGDQSAQSERAFPDAPRQKQSVLASNRLGLVPTIWPGATLPA